jgi:dihydroorotase-like cyclic amidohydrolase
MEGAGAMPFDLVLAGGEVVLPGTDGVAADIGVRDGRIAGVFARGTVLPARELVDVAGLFVLPGVIDVHLHLGHGADISRPRVPQDAAQETGAAAAGGVTTFIPYLMSNEPFEDIFDDVSDVTTRGARIDFGYHFIISTEAQLAGIAHYSRELGVPSFKIFMNNRGGEGKRLGLPDIDDGFLFRLCEAAAASNGMVCPHPENIEVAWVLRERLMKADPEGKGGLRSWNASRPAFIEADAVQRAALLARETNARLYIVHTSSQAALATAAQARAAGTVITIETCPQYLTHDVDWAGGSVGKINPPLRERADRDALWAGIADGTVDTVATDHVHRVLASKEGGIWKASPGCPGLESLLPVMLSEGHHQRGLSLGRIVDLLSTGPAQAMGLSHRKGSIALGHDADFAIVDLDRVNTPSKASVRSSAGYSLYEGSPLRGAVVHTVVRGRFALRNGELVDTAVGTGRFVPRHLQ